MAGLAAAFGSGAMTNPIRDVLSAKSILLTGTNTTENHPIFANYVKEAIVKNGCKLIVVDPRKIDIVELAHIWLRPRPGNDVAWINGLLHVIIRENLHDEDYIQNRTTGFDELRACVEKYTPEYVSGITGIPPEDIVEAAVTYGGSKPSSILYAMGITQHTNGTNNVKSLANIAMLCGNVGVVGGGVNPLRGQNNVQGACDLGALPNVYTGYQQVANEDVRSKFAAAWGVDHLSSTPGLTVTEMFGGAERGTVHAIYVMGENPMVSDPDINHIRECIEALEFFVVQDIFMTETARLADVVLPVACFAEKDGTFTNSERKVQRIRKAVDPPGEAREDRFVIAGIARLMGFPLEYPDTRSIMQEIARVTPSYAGITYERIERDGITWPCTSEEHPGSPILHVGTFTRGKGVFTAIEYKDPAEVTDDEYPYILTTGRVLQHYHTGSMTRRGTGLNRLYPELLAELNPDDAGRLGIGDGEMITLSSRRGTITVKAKLTERSGPGVVFVPFHFSEAAINVLTNSALDPTSKIPEYKVCSIKVEKASM